MSSSCGRIPRSRCGPVVVDRSVAGESVIASGLAVGDSVVVEGQLRLAPGMQVEPHPAGKAMASDTEP